MRGRTTVLFGLLIGGLAACNGGGETVGRGAAGWPEIGLVSVASGLSQPVHVSGAGDHSGRLFVVERSGVIRVMRGGTVAAAPFLDIRHLVGSSGGEQGLLSVAFPPGFTDHFYVMYTDISGDSVLARVHVSADPEAADPESIEVLLTVAQPFANHNGGQLAFGPDGFLYAGLGDGGSAGDPLGNAQNPASLLGKLLRLDVEGGAAPYGVPTDNPFGDEIWAAGLRNPWRFSFDRGTGDLYIADVGQARYEEVNFQPAGGAGGRNYGWNVMEGRHCFSTADCDQTGLTPPVAEYAHDQGDCSITGGFVYRGDRHPELRGIYLYGDLCTGRIWGLRRIGDAWDAQVLDVTGLQISSFGEDDEGEIYVASYGDGRIARIAVP